MFIFLMVSKNVKIVIAIVIAIIIVGTAFAVLYHPSVKPVFTDVSQTAAPPSLDPATGFFTTNGPLFAALF